MKLKPMQVLCILLLSIYTRHIQSRNESIQVIAQRVLSLNMYQTYSLQLPGLLCRSGYPKLVFLRRYKSTIYLYNCTCSVYSALPGLS